MANASESLSAVSDRLIIESEKITMQFRAKKSVSFADTSQLKFIDYPSSVETYARWYNKHDSARFRELRAQDVMKYSRLVIAKIEQNGRLSPEDRLHLIGLEQEVSFNVKQQINRIIVLRKNHVYKVLLEQEQQRVFNECCEERLGKASEASSKWSRAFAYRLAVSSTWMQS
jgi:hypothetical protein